MTLASCGAGQARRSDAVLLRRGFGGSVTRLALCSSPLVPHSAQRLAIWLTRAGQPSNPPHLINGQPEARGGPGGWAICRSGQSSSVVGEAMGKVGFGGKKSFDLGANSKVYNAFMRSGMFVSELAKEAGVDPWTIRYYEKERLIPQAPRSATRYRLYPHDTVNLIRFIKTAQGLGLTLEEIKKVIEAKRLKGKPCDRVVQLLETKTQNLHQKIGEMERLRGTILGLLKNWKRVRNKKTTCICEIIESAGQKNGKKRRGIIG